VLAHYHSHFGWDVTVAREIQSIKAPVFSDLMFGLSWLGSGVVPFAIVVAVSLILMCRRWPIAALVCLVGTALGSWMDQVLKVLTGRPRPAAPLVQVAMYNPHQSFPSGHVFFFVEFFGFLLFLIFVLAGAGPLRKISMAILGLLIAFIGISRVYLGAHWPSDVAGGYLAGGIWLLAMIEAYSWLIARSQGAAREAAATD
jgi:membrane-associated phospholipid phosphatase